jgi:hypothetical protein
VARGWRNPHNEETRNLYSSPSIIRIINSKKMRWAKICSTTVRREMDVDYGWENQTEKDQ